MIYLYSGTPGSGKSLHVARTMRETLQKKRLAIGNFDLATEKIKGIKGEFIKLENWELTPDKLIEIAKEYWNGGRVKEEHITLVIDECQLLFNARDWNAKGRNEWLSFFTQHRKYGYRIILVAQFDRMIDRQIRSLIEYEYVHRKISNYGTAGLLLSLVAFGKLFVCVQIWYPMKEKVGSNFFKAKPKDWTLYDTFNTFDS